MKKSDCYCELLKKRAKAEKRLASLKPKLGHPHSSSQATDELADQEFKVWTDYLNEIEGELNKINKG